jgi:glyoxalase family protein
MKSNIPSLHRVTVMAGAPQRNLDFYAGVLGLRLVKRTVNFDDPGTYHFYFGDALGTQAPSSRSSRGPARFEDARGMA